MLENDEGGDAVCGCKVGMLSRDYELDDVDSVLVERWTARDGDSVRDLADWFNKQLIQKKLEEKHEMLLDQEIDLFYDLLQSDDVPTWTRIEAENRLDEFNLDVEQLDEEFVSHQTMYRHLKNCLSAEKERTIEPEKIRENFREKVGRLEQRIEMVVTEELERFSNKPWFTIGEFDVFVSVAVMCRDCSRHEDVRTLVADGGCDCDRDDRPANE